MTGLRPKASADDINCRTEQSRNSWGCERQERIKPGNKAKGDAEGDTVRCVIGSRPTSAKNKHLQLRPTQLFAYGGRTGVDVKWWKIVCMYGAHVRFDQSLVNGSRLHGLQGQPLVKSRNLHHAQDVRQDLERFKSCDDSRRQELQR